MEQSVFINRENGQAAPLPFKRKIKGVPLYQRAAPTIATSYSSSIESSYSALASSPTEAPDGGSDGGLFSSKRHPSSIQTVNTPSRKRSWAPSVTSPTWEQPSLTSAAATTSTITSRPLKTPQGEFSFEHQARYDASGDVQGLPHESRAYPSSTWRLNHLQQQELERQRALEEEQDRQRSEPPAKRRRGMAGAIVETALNATLMAGAAAITAYSLWSSWGRKGEDGEEQDRDSAIGPEDDDAAQRIPGGMHTDHEPPPPYYDENRQGPGTPLSPNKSQGSIGGIRPRHVFISQRRRRAVMPSYRNSPRAHIRDIAAAMQKQAANSVSSSSSPSVSTQPAPPAEPLSQPDEVEGDEDEVFKRFQERMQSMIAEGQAALSSTPDLEGIDAQLVDDLPPSPLTPSRSEPLFAGQQGGDYLSATIRPSQSIDSAASPQQSLASVAQGFDFKFSQQPDSVFHAPGGAANVLNNPFTRASSSALDINATPRARLQRQQATPTGRRTMGRAAGNSPYPRSPLGPNTFSPPSSRR